MRDRRAPQLDPADEVDAGDPFPERTLGGGVEPGDVRDSDLVPCAALVPFGLEAVDRVAARRAVDLEDRSVLGHRTGRGSPRRRVVRRAIGRRSG